MKALVNMRFPLLVAIAFVAGILITVSMIYKFWFVAVAVFATAFFVLVLLFAFKKKKAANLLCLFFAVVTVGMSLSAFAAAFESNRQIGTANGTLEGVVTQSTFTDNYLRLVLRDCVFESTDGQAFESFGNVSVSMFLYEQSDSFDFSIGNKVTLVGTIKNEYIFKSEIKTFNYKNNIAMSFFDVTLATSTFGQPNFSESVKLFVLNTLESTIPQNSDIAYALLVGDKSFVSDTDISNFQNSGILHILAVSGLHVGFVVAVLTLIFDKLKLKPIFQMPVILVPLCLYMVICSFSPSVVRAVVMVAVSLLSRVIFSKSDLLNSLSIAAIVILVVKPFYIFDAGFLLSFFSVFGIATFSAAANRVFVRKKINNSLQRLASSAFVSAGATLGTLPFAAYFFGRISLVSVFSNLVTIPAVSVAYTLSFVGMIPFLNFLLWVPDKIFALIKLFSQAVSGISFSAVDFLGVGVLSAIALILFFFVVGGFVNLRLKAKVIVSFCLALVSVGCAVLNVLPKDTDFEVFVAESYSECLVVATDNNNTAYIFSNLTNANDIELTKKFLAKKRIFEVQLFTVEFEKVNLENAIALSKEFPLTRVYIFDTSGNSVVENYFEATTLFVYVLPRFSVDGGITVTSIYDGVLTALEVELRDFSFAIVFAKNAEIASNTKHSISNEVSFLYCLRFPDLVANAFPEKTVLANSEYQQSNIYALNRYGNFTIKRIDDIIPIWNF